MRAHGLCGERAFRSSVDIVALASFSSSLLLSLLAVCLLLPVSISTSVRLFARVLILVPPPPRPPMIV